MNEDYAKPFWKKIQLLSDLLNVRGYHENPKGLTHKKTIISS